MTTLFENIALQYLKRKRQKGLRNVDVNRPIQLLTQFRAEFTPGSETSENLVQSVLQHTGVSRKNNCFALTEEYVQFKAALDSELTIFDNKPFQLGALDDEIHIISEILYNLAKPSVLEIGVANGYSSAFLYLAIEKSGGRITSIDLPKFPRRPIRPSEILRHWLAKRGKIQNTGTLGDLNPGGMIPKEKYGGWLVPLNLRMSVSNMTITGNAFNIFHDFPENLKFDFAVVDAMKEYEGRMRILDLVASHLNVKGLCALDGYWVNPAFDDFCKQHRKPSWKFGRVGLFANT
jgi:hypothetical protein